MKLRRDVASSSLVPPLLLFLTARDGLVSRGAPDGPFNAGAVYAPQGAGGIRSTGETTVRGFATGLVSTHRLPHTGWGYRPALLACCYQIDTCARSRLAAAALYREKVILAQAARGTFDAGA